MESIAQGWSYTKVATDHYKFLDQLSGLCLDAFDAVNGASGTPAQIWLIGF